MLRHSALRAGLAGASLITSALLAACSADRLTDPEGRPLAGAVAAVRLSPDAPSLYPGDTMTLRAEAFDERGAALAGRVATWASTDTTVLTVAGGLLRARAIGSATVLATIDGITGTVEVPVRPTPVAAVGLTLNSTRVELGQLTRGTAVLRDARGNTLTDRIVLWGTDNPSVIQVDPDGLVRTVGTGDAIVRAESEGVHADVTLTVVAPVVRGVVVDPAVATIRVGEQLRFAASGRDALGNVIQRTTTWAPGDAAVASVAADGLVTGRAAGTTTVLATIDGVTGQATLTVAPAADPVPVVSPTSASVVVGGTVQATAEMRDASGAVVPGVVFTWTTSNAGVATVSSTGLVRAVAAGSATIAATANGKTASLALTVTPVPVASVRVTPSSASLVVGQSVTLAAACLDASGNALGGRTIGWRTADAAIAVVDAVGTVRAMAAGATDVVASCEGREAAARISVALAPVASVTILPDGATLAVGASTQFTATPRDAGGSSLTGRVITWSSLEPAVASVGTTGRATALAAGTARIVAASEGKADTVLVTVPAPPPPSGGGSDPRRLNEPAGLTRLLEHSFDQIPGATTTAGTQFAITGGGWTTWEQTNLHIVDDATAPVSASKVAEIRWPQGLDDGERNGSFFEGDLGGDYRELYVSIRFRIVGTTFENQSVGTKLLGYVSYGGYDRQNQFFWLLKERDYCVGDGPGGIRSGPFQLESRLSVYYTQTLSDGISGWHCPSRQVQYLNNNQGTGNTVRLNEWVHIEAYFRLNTKNADGSYQRDGVLKQWINGQLVQSYSNLDWLSPETAKVGDHGFYQLHFDPIWGGNSGDIKSRDDRMLVDHVYLSGTRQ